MTGSRGDLDFGLDGKATLPGWNWGQPLKSVKNT